MKFIRVNRNAAINLEHVRKISVKNLASRAAQKNGADEWCVQFDRTPDSCEVIPFDTEARAREFFNDLMAELNGAEND